METKAYGSITITDVADAYSVGLTNESHVFPGTTDHADIATASTKIIAYKGSTAKTVTIQSVNGVDAKTSGTSTGITGLYFQCSMTSGVEPEITFHVSTSFKTKACSIPIVFTVDDVEFTKIFSCSISFKGDQGDKGDTPTVVSQRKQYHLTAAPTADSENRPEDDSNYWNYDIKKVTLTDGTKTWTDAITITDGATSPSYSIWERTETTWSHIVDPTYLYVHRLDSLEIAEAVAASEGKSVGALCAEKGITVIDGATIMTGTIEANRIKTDELQVNAANITGTLTIGQLPSTVAETSDIPTESEITTITNNTLKTTNVTATNLQVNAANITGTLTADQIAANAITAEKIKAGAVTASKINVNGKLEVSGDASISGWSLSNSTISKDAVGMHANDNTTSDIITTNKSPIRFYAGNSDITNAPFQVLNDGTVIAKKIYLYVNDNQLVAIDGSSSLTSNIVLSDSNLTKIKNKVVNDTIFINAVAESIASNYSLNPSIIYGNIESTN